MNWELLLLCKLLPCSGELLVKRERYYYDVFMSGDLTGLCLYIQRKSGYWSQKIQNANQHVIK